MASALRLYEQQAPQRPLSLFGAQEPITVVQPIPVTPEWLELVGKYLLTWAHANPDNARYWQIILAAGLRGYSVYLHERAELEKSFEMKLDFFRKEPRPDQDRTDQVRGYRPAHAWALLLEHRYLQVREGEEGPRHSLKELMVANPHGMRLTDWAMFREEYMHGGLLQEQDWRSHPTNLREARRWFRKHGFYEGF